MGGVEERPSNEVLPKSSVGNGLPVCEVCVCVCVCGGCVGVECVCGEVVSVCEQRVIQDVEVEGGKIKLR